MSFIGPRTKDDLFCDLIEREEYQEAIDFLHRYPQMLANDDGENALYALILLCMQVDQNTEETAVELARLMLQQWPDFADEHRDHFEETDRTPLQHCVDFKEDENGTPVPRSTSLALMLIQAYPEGVNVRDPNGWTPFHLACEANADFEVLKAMLEVNPDLASQEGADGWFLTPLDWLWEANNSTIDDRAALIILTALKGRVMDPLPTKHIVHAACNYQCPVSFYTKLFEMENKTLQQLAIRDDQGNLPLHYAIRASFMHLRTPTLIHVSPRLRTDWLHNVSTDLVGSLLDKALETASMTNREGQLPLFTALGNRGASWVRGSILKVAEAFPQALHRRDAENKLFPVLLAPATRANESTEHLSVTYELLLKTPEMMLHALGRNGNSADET